MRLLMNEKSFYFQCHNMSHETTPRFPLGHIVFTPGAIDTLGRLNVEPRTLLARHQSGDWGDLGDEDKQENELSINEGFRIFSAYTIGDQDRIYIITEADRSSTCLLTPEEY